MTAVTLLQEPLMKPCLRHVLPGRHLASCQDCVAYVRYQIRELQK